MPKAKKTDKQRIYILDTIIFMAEPRLYEPFWKTYDRRTGYGY